MTEPKTWPLLLAGELPMTADRSTIRSPRSGDTVGLASEGSRVDVVVALDAATAAAPAAAAAPGHARPAVLERIADALTSETIDMLGPIETVTVKTAFSGSAAATLSPARVHRMLHDAAANAVRRTRRGELKPLVFEKPYRVRLCLRRQYARDEWVRTTIGRFEGMVPDGDPGCFAYTTTSAEAVGNLLNGVEWTVLKP